MVAVQVNFWLSDENNNEINPAKIDEDDGGKKN